MAMEIRKLRLLKEAGLDPDKEFKTAAEHEAYMDRIDKFLANLK